MGYSRLQKSVLLLIISSIALSAGAQQEKAPAVDDSSLTVRSTTHMVVLDVVVAKQRGSTIDSLPESSFTVLEDGVPQKIVSFEAPAAHYRKAQVESSPRTIVVIDELNTDPINGARARQAAKRFFAGQRTYLQQPMALLVLSNHGLMLLQGYTRDPRILADVIARHKPELPWHLMHDNTTQGAGWRFGMMVRALEEIAQASVNRQSRKNVIWMSTGYPVLSLDHMFSSEVDKLNTLITDLSKMLMEARISVYTIDPEGISGEREYTPAGGSPFGFFSESNLVSGDLIFERIGPETGGRVCRLRNDLADCIRDDAVDGAMYYTLAYYPSNKDWNGKFRRISVKVDRPDADARTRLGYFAISDPEQVTDEQIDFSLSLAVRNPISYTAIPLTASGKHLADPKQAELTVKVDRSALTWSKADDGGLRTEITVVTASLNRDDKVLGYKVREFEMKVPKGKRPNFKEIPMTLRVPVEVPAKASRIRCVVRDAQNEHLGTIDLEASTLTAMTLSEPESEAASRTN